MSSFWSHFTDFKNFQFRNGKILNSLLWQSVYLYSSFKRHFLQSSFIFSQILSIKFPTFFPHSTFVFVHQLLSFCFANHLFILWENLTSKWHLRVCVCVYLHIGRESFDILKCSICSGSNIGIKQYHIIDMREKLHVSLSLKSRHKHNAHTLQICNNHQKTINTEYCQNAWYLESPIRGFLGSANRTINGWSHP